MELFIGWVGSEVDKYKNIIFYYSTVRRTKSEYKMMESVVAGLHQG